MPTPVEIKQMALSEKLRLMEALWDELCGREEDVPVPDWHKAILDEREQQIAEGQAVFVDWENAKERIRKRIS
jgi:putative addiction module component (TIGR02574 family)